MQFYFRLDFLLLKTFQQLLLALQRCAVLLDKTVTMVYQRSLFQLMLLLYFHDKRMSK